MFSLAKAGDLKRQIARLSGMLTGPKRDQIYVLPTWYCAVFNFLIFTLLMTSFFSRNVFLFSLCIFVIFIQLLSMVESHVNLREISLSIQDLDPVQAGSKTVMPVGVRSVDRSYGVSLKFLPINDGDHASLSPKNIRSMIFRELGSSLKFWGTSKFYDNEHSLALEKNPITFELSFEAGRRGIHKVPPIAITSFFPFGLFKAIKVVDFNIDYAAYPVPTEVIPTRVSTAVDDKISIGRSNAMAGVMSSDDYIFHRDFISGDILRRIDWRASSRRTVKVVKVFGGGGSQTNEVFRWQDMPSTDKEGKLSELSSLINAAAKSGSRFGLELPSFRVALGSGHRHRLDCLRALASFDLIHNSNNIEGF